MPVLVRARANPLPLVHAIGAAIHAVDPILNVDAITLADALSISPRIVVARCSGLFATVIGLLGLLLASAGIYGSVSYAVVRRTREFGIRVALGADKSDVFRLALSETARPVLIGLLGGLIAAASAAQFLRAILAGVSTLDPLAFLGVSVFFLGIALLAAFVPARRALRIDPMTALRCD
jgi:ABC-type antimicrobial peptide transport system permease subunit